MLREYIGIGGLAQPVLLVPENSRARATSRTPPRHLPEHICQPVRAAAACDSVTSAVSRLGSDLQPRFAASLQGPRESVDRLSGRGPGTPAETSGRTYLEFPARREDKSERAREPELVRVRLTVPYRVHSRQMLCIGGSQIPFGWSFLSIAKVPMTWTEGDVWQAEVCRRHYARDLFVD